MNRYSSFSIDFYEYLEKKAFTPDASSYVMSCRVASC